MKQLTHQTEAINWTELTLWIRTNRDCCFGSAGVVCWCCKCKFVKKIKQWLWKKEHAEMSPPMGAQWTVDRRWFLVVFQPSLETRSDLDPFVGCRCSRWSCLAASRRRAGGPASAPTTMTRTRADSVSRSACWRSSASRRFSCWTPCSSKSRPCSTGNTPSWRRWVSMVSCVKVRVCESVLEKALLRRFLGLRISGEMCACLNVWISLTPLTCSLQARGRFSGSCVSAIWRTRGGRRRGRPAARACRAWKPPSPSPSSPSSPS